MDRATSGKELWQWVGLAERSYLTTNGVKHEQTPCGGLVAATTREEAQEAALQAMLQRFRQDGQGWKFWMPRMELLPPGRLDELLRMCGYTLKRVTEEE